MQSVEPRISIPESWSDDYGIALRGWILTRNGPPRDLSIRLNNEHVPIVQWHRRPDLLAKYPQYQSAEECGFWAYLPRNAKGAVEIAASCDGKSFTRRVTIAPRATDHDREWPPHELFERFRGEANCAGRSVLEIGSRVVCAGSSSQRSRFDQAASFTGFDIYPDENTDVSGDAHRLASFFTRRFDAVFSLLVLEHLAMPWLVAAQVNSVLPIGGLTYHLTHFAFPLHEQPADYWRFSEQALAVLFGPAHGFEVLGCAYGGPVHLHPEGRTPDLLCIPQQPAFTHVAVLARKVRELDKMFAPAAAQAEAAQAVNPYPSSAR